MAASLGTVTAEETVIPVSATAVIWAATEPLVVLNSIFIPGFNSL